MLSYPLCLHVIVNNRFAQVTQQCVRTTLLYSTRMRIRQEEIEDYTERKRKKKRRKNDDGLAG